MVSVPLKYRVVLHRVENQRKKMNIPTETVPLRLVLRKAYNIDYKGSLGKECTISADIALLLVEYVA